MPKMFIVRVLFSRAIVGERFMRSEALMRVRVERIEVRMLA